jgi:hypothetical protein
MGLDCLKQHPERIIYGFSSVRKIFFSHLFPTIGGVIGWEFFRFVFKIISAFLFIISILSVVLIFYKKIKIEGQFKKYFYLMALIVLCLPVMVYFQNIGEERYIIPYAPLLIILSIPMFLSAFYENNSQK